MSNIFSIKSKKRTKQDIMIGSHIDPDIYSYLALYTLAFQINKSALLRRLVKDWYEKTEKTNSPDSLIREIINTAQKKWENTKTSGSFYFTPENRNTRFNEFKRELEEELKARGILDEYIDRVTKNLEE